MAMGMGLGAPEEELPEELVEDTEALEDGMLLLWQIGIAIVTWSVGLWSNI